MWWSLVQRSSTSWTFVSCCPPPFLSRQPCSTPNPLCAHFTNVWHTSAIVAWIVLKYPCDEANNLKLAVKSQISQATQGTTNPTCTSHWTVLLQQKYKYKYMMDRSCNQSPPNSNIHAQATTDSISNYTSHTLSHKWHHALLRPTTSKQKQKIPQLQLESTSKKNPCAIRNEGVHATGGGPTRGLDLNLRRECVGELLFCV